MGIGWMTALKLVPWGEVIEVAPQLVQGARKLLKSARKGKSQDLAGNEPQPLATRIAQLEDMLQSSVGLLESLSEQNARLVEAVEALRQRQQRLVWAVAVLGAACVGLGLWAAGLRP